MGGAESGSSVSRRALLTGTTGGMALTLGSCAGGPTPVAASGSPTTQPTPRSSTTHEPTTTTTAPASLIAERATVPVLCYHQVREWRASDSAYNRELLVCPPEAFAAQLDAMARAGFTTISPEQYRAHLFTGAALPDRPVMVSLDDGKDNQAEQALSAIADRGMTATFFIMTVVIGKEGWMTERDVGRLADAGMTVGSHTWDHHRTTEYAGDDFDVQLAGSRSRLRELSGQPVVDFAYPYGIWDSSVLPHVADAGYEAAFQLEAQPLDADRPELTLRRQIAVSTWSGPDVVDALSRYM